MEIPVVLRFVVWVGTFLMNRAINHKRSECRRLMRLVPLRWRFGDDKLIDATGIICYNAVHYGRVASQILSRTAG
jgi:hypothetical protein